MSIPRKNAALWAGVLTIFISCLVLTGWFFDIAVLKSISPDFISMKFNTAVSFLLTGTCMVLIERKKSKWLVCTLAVIVVLVALLTLSEYIFLVNLGIDEWLWKDAPLSAYTKYPGRPSAFTALNFTLIGLSILSICRNKFFGFTWFAISISFLVSLVSCISYLFGNPDILIVTSLTVIALHTSILFIVVCVGLYQGNYFTNAQLSFQRRMIAVFLVIGFGLSLIVYLDSKSDKNNLDNHELVTQNITSINSSDSLAAIIIRMESGIRGFLLLRDSALHVPLTDNRKIIFEQVQKLKVSIQNNPTLHHTVDTLEALLGKRLELFGTALSLQAESPEFTEKIRTELKLAVPVTNHILSLLSRVKHAQQLFMQQKQQENAVNISKSNRVILFLGFCILAIFVSTILFIFRNTSAREKAEAEARQLAITLEKKVEERTLQLNEANDNLHKLAAHLQHVREEERTLIAREVHDELGQLASALKMDIDWMKIRLKESESPVSDRLEHATRTSELLIKATRKIAQGLRPVMIDELGLNESLRWQCLQFEKNEGIPCTFTEATDDTHIPVRVSNELFRICQEALANIARHAAATRVQVSLQSSATQLELLISDNGHGFDTEEKTDSIGIIGMRERAHAMQAAIRISSSSGKGTEIRVTVPLTSTGLNG